MSRCSNLRANTWKKLAGDFTIRRLTIVLGIVRKEILCVKKKKKKKGGGEKKRKSGRDREGKVEEQTESEEREKRRWKSSGQAFSVPLPRQLAT